MSKIEIFNPLNDPVVFSEQGHVLGGGDRLEVEELDAHGRNCVERGYLLVTSEEEPETRTAEAPEGKEDTAVKDRRRATTKAKSGDADSGASTGSDVD